MKYELRINEKGKQEITWKRIPMPEVLERIRSSYYPFRPGDEEHLRSLTQEEGESNGYSRCRISRI